MDHSALSTVHILSGTKQITDERAPLLSYPSVVRGSITRAEYVEWLAEMWFLTKASTPVIMAYMLQNSLQTVSIIVAGHLSSKALGVAAFSYMFAMATAWLIALGGTSAIDTLASSAFTASQDKGSLGVLLQRGIFVLTGFYGVVAVSWWYSEHIFRALGQPELICIHSSRFLQLLIPGGLGYVWFECMKKYLQAQQIYRPGTYALLIASPLNALLNYLFIYTLDFGLYGAPIATGISYWTSFLLLVAYTAFVQGSECWNGFHPSRALVNTKLFARLAFLGVIHVGTEWWAFEIVALAAGHLGTTSLAAQSAIMTMDQIINTIPFGLGVAESVRLGNLLGLQDTRASRISAHCAALLSVFLGTIILTILLSTRNVLGRLFSDDIKVVSLVADVVPYVALFQIADGLNGSCGGALRGMGRQWVGAAVNGISYYGGALPGGMYLAFHGWGLSGLWMGQCVSLTLAGLLELIVVTFSNWDAEVQNAVRRLEEEDN